MLSLMPGFPLKLALLTAALMSALLNAQTTTLSYTPVGAEYSAALDRIIMVSANPNQLHIYDPATQAELQVGLPKPPLTLSVSPDGMYAAVGHDALVSYVNLASASMVQTYDVSFTVQAVVPGPSWIYVLAPSVISINIATGATTATNFGNTGATAGRLDTPRNAIYAGGAGGLLEYDISTGPITDQFYFNNNLLCGAIWLSPDGSRLYDGCATAFTALSSPTPSAAYLTTFTGITSVGALAASMALDSVAVVPNGLAYPPANDGVVTLFDANYLQPVAQFVLPAFTAGGSSVTPHGKWVFFNGASTDLFVLMQGQTSSGAPSGFAVQTFSLAAPAPCGATLASSTATVIAAGALGAVGVTDSATCTYQATSNSSWLQLVSGGYGAGNGTLTYIARANSTPSPRTGVISIAGQTLTVTQAAAPAPIAGQTFTVTQAAGTLFSISGQVTHAGTGLSGVTIVLSTGASAITDSSGNYSFSSLLSGVDYTVTPRLVDSSFNPPNLTFNALSSNETANFQANLQYDFNGGPGPDVIWQDPKSGFAQVWYLGGPQGVTVTGAANLTQSNTWHIVGVGDFDGNGTPDVLWQDPVSGALQVWFLGGPGGNLLTGAVNITNGNAWRVVSVADFNQDGHPDLLWQDPASGFSQIWYMGGPEGITFLSAADLDQTNPWRIVGSADFNGDGVPDVLWQDPTTGTVQIWYMGGTQPGAQGSQLQSAANLTSNPWHIVALADFNLDGHPDVVFQDPVSGAAQVFFYTGAQGTTLSGTAALSGPNPWYIAGPH